MLDLLHISAPPLTGGVIQAAVGVGAIALGLALLLFGRLVWQLLSGLALAAGGVLAAQRFAGSWNVHPLIPPVLLGLSGAVLGVLLARLWWAVMLAALLAATAMTIALWRVGPIEPGAVEAMPAVETLAEWAGQAGWQAQRCLRWLWEHHSLVALAAGGGAGLAALAVGLWRTVFTRIVLTCLIGATACVLGSVLLLAAFKRGFDFSAGYRPFVLLGIGVVLGAVGMIYQYHSTRRGGAAEKEENESSAPKKKDSGDQ